MKNKYRWALVVAGCFMPILENCTTSRTDGIKDVLLSETNAPSGTVGCLSPKIVTQNGKCQDPKRLSWQ